jgi:hypothetical protein
MCASVFLDVEQAFDKVWHEGLSYKLKSKMPDLKSYPEERYFQVETDDTLCYCHLIRAGVPQGSVIGPLLNIYC